MSSRILVLVMAAFVTMCWASRAMAQAAPTSPVTGAIKSVAADKTFFVVTVKKADVTVKVAPDTKYTLDDTPSDFAKAVVVDRDVNAILTSSGNAFVVLVTNVPVKGTVKSVAADKASFVLTPKTGADITVKVNAATKYTLDKAASTLPLALVAGNTVTPTLGADGVATDVAAKSAKAPKAPASGPVVAPSPMP